MRVGYFLEDRGHESFVRALVARTAREKGFPQEGWVDDVRASTGGKSIQAYREFLKGLRGGVQHLPFDVLIIASYGNCHGYLERKNQLVGYAQRMKLTELDRIVFAIPDPHIERWYMADPKAFNRVFGGGNVPALPAYKCQKSFYKKVMQDAIASSEVTPQFRGYEYGPRIVDEMNLYVTGKEDPSLKHFLDDLADAITRVKESGVS